MKRHYTSRSKVLFLFLLLAVAGAAEAQNYETILKTDSTSWITCHLELETKEEGHAFVNKRDSLLYYAPYGNTDYYCVGRLREDAGRLWITYSEHPSEEILLMDMNLEEGDEFLVTPYRVAHVVETSYENGRKTIVFDFVSPFWGGEPLKFIEGVGRNYMLFEWYGNIDRDYQSCKYDGDELVYSTANLLFEGCRYDNTSIDDSSKEDGIMKVYPNPAHNEVRVCFADSQDLPQEISILNPWGIIMKTIPVTSGTAILSVEDLCSGVYVIKTVCQNRVLKEKLVIN